MKAFSLAIGVLAALLASKVVANPYTISTDHQEVTDNRTGLIWRRCPEGMIASSTRCSGTPQLFTPAQALLRAKSEALAAGLNWRMPNIKELASIVDRSRTYPAIDLTAFPDTPSAYFWSSTPFIHAIVVHTRPTTWDVGFDQGRVTSSVSSGAIHIRLVRDSQ
jgi:hypothetical protein